LARQLPHDPRHYGGRAAIGDELAFRSVAGSANPDREILAALRPARDSTK
jgi:hypothetical protein